MIMKSKEIIFESSYDGKKIIIIEVRENMVLIYVFCIYKIGVIWILCKKKRKKGNRYSRKGEVEVIGDSEEMIERIILSMGVWNLEYR